MSHAATHSYAAYCSLVHSSREIKKEGERECECVGERERERQREIIEILYCKLLL